MSDTLLYANNGDPHSVSVILQVIPAAPMQMGSELFFLQIRPSARACCRVFRREIGRVKVVSIFTVNGEKFGNIILTNETRIPPLLLIAFRRITRDN